MQKVLGGFAVVLAFALAACTDGRGASPQGGGAVETKRQAVVSRRPSPTTTIDPYCTTTDLGNGITSHRCWTPAGDPSTRVTLTPIECPADLPPTETDCHMGSDGELRSRSTVGTDLPPPASRYIPPPNESAPQRQIAVVVECPLGPLNLVDGQRVTYTPPCVRLSDGQSDRILDGRGVPVLMITP